MKCEARHNSEIIIRTGKKKKPSEYFKTIPQQRYLYFREEVELGLGTSPLKDEQATVCKDNLKETTFCEIV